MAKQFEQYKFAQLAKTKIPANELTVMYPVDQDNNPNVAQARLCIKGQTDWNYNHDDPSDPNWFKKFPAFEGYEAGYAVNEQSKNLVKFSGRDLHLEKNVADKASVAALAELCGMQLGKGEEKIYTDTSLFINPCFFRPDIKANDKKLKSIFKKLEKPQRMPFPFEPVSFLDNSEKVDRKLNIDEIAILAARVREIAQQGLNLERGDDGYEKLGKFRPGNGISKHALKIKKEQTNDNINNDK